MVAGFVAMGSAFGQNGCVEPETVTPEVSCEDSRRAIALRTQACEADPELANKRFDAAESMPCLLKQTNVGAGYECSAATLKRSCEEVKTLGDNLAAWVQDAPCSTVLGPPGTAAPSGGAGASGAAGQTTVPPCTTTDTGCRCSVSLAAGEQNRASCDVTAPSPELGVCCASADFPGAGSCSCQRVTCNMSGASGAEMCVCSLDLPFERNTSDCTRQLFPILQGACCLALGGRSCTCSQNPSCAEGETQVAECDRSVFCTASLTAERKSVLACVP